MKTADRARVPSARIYLTALALLCGLGACVAAEVPEAEQEVGTATVAAWTDPVEPVSTRPDDQTALNLSPGAGATCCSFGAYYCPRNLDVVVDYDPPGCGALTKPAARRSCDRQCSVSCVDTGWQDAC